MLIAAAKSWLTAALLLLFALGRGGDPAADSFECRVRKRRVALIVAKRIGRKVGLDTATRMAKDADRQGWCSFIAARSPAALASASHIYAPCFVLP
jgi:hypothetical protein